MVIHVLRPYSSEEEYLASEGFSITPKFMLLIDQPPLPAETTIVFDVSLLNGQKPIRAEGVVLGYAESGVGQAGGLRVRFKRYGAATKAFIDRANSPDDSLLSAGAAAVSAPHQTESRVSLVSLPPVASLETEAHAEAEVQPADSSGVHRKVVLPVAPPANREALLKRLRARRFG